MSLRAAEKFLGKDIEMKNGRMFLGDNEIQTDADRNLTINYAGPPYTFPRVSVAKVLEAYRAHNADQLKKWFDGRVVLLGPDSREDSRPTPFYTAFSSDKWTTPGVEVHANSIRTLLSGEYLKPVPEWMRIAALAIAASICVAISVSFAVTQTLAWASLALVLLMAGTHVLFRQGQLLSTSQILLSFGWALLGGIVYRFATAEKKSSFFRNAIGLFVGKQVASSLDQSGTISLTGKRQLVTILFTDIRGFTAFCESRDPAIVVDLLNVYMSKMVSIIVKYGGHVNKFIGDGILAVFCDDDAGAVPGDHALRCCRCANEMVQEVIGDFKTGAGFHVGEVIIGNVGSEDKLEFTVLGNTVNMAARLESLNKDAKSRLLMSEEAREMLGGKVDTIYLGAVPVKGKSTDMKIYTVTSLLDSERIAQLRETYPVETAA
jgi:adenylate cyclase